MISNFKVLIKLYIYDQFLKTVKKILSFMTKVIKHEKLICLQSCVFDSIFSLIPKIIKRYESQ